MMVALIEVLQKEEDLLDSTEVEDTEDRTIRAFPTTAVEYSNRQHTQEDFEHEVGAAFNHQDQIMVPQTTQNSCTELASTAAYGDYHIAVEVH